MSTERHATEPGRFARSFARWARRVRVRRLTRRMLGGMAVGLAAGGAAAALLWWQRLGELRPWAAALGLAGGLAGLLLGLRRRWSDQEVALYLDARLRSEEAISTAVELHTGAVGSEPVRATVVRRAADALAAGDPRAARPRMLDPWHTLAPLGLAAVVALSLAPLPAPPPPPIPEPGADVVQVAELAGLERIIAVEQLDARDAEQRRRLERIAQRARELGRDLARGIPRREAQARIAKLRDDIAAERLRFGDEMNRAGLDAAVRKLGEDPFTRRAARALGNGDLVSFDEQMRRLASRAEKEDREAAKHALEEAARAARQKGAEAVADALDEQRQLLDERAAESDALRELAEGLRGELSEQARRDLEEFGQTGSPEARERLAEAMREALEGLSDQQRQRLAERLREQLEREEGSVEPMTREQIEEMARRLSSEQGQEQLSEMLSELARPDPGPEARRERGLGDAERGGAQCQRQLGGAVPVPMQGSGSDGARHGSPGSDHDEGQGDHGGKTDPVPGQELRAKAEPTLDPRAPMRGTSMGRTAARAGETADQQGAGALGRVAPEQVSGVQRSEVPQEYRDQVGRYFEP